MIEDLGLCVNDGTGRILAGYGGLEVFSSFAAGGGSGQEIGERFENPVRSHGSQ
jgi:hypothetical protein